MTPKRIVSEECIQELLQWIRAECPIAFEIGEFMPGLFVIIDDEVRCAVRKERARLHESMAKEVSSN